MAFTKIQGANANANASSLTATFASGTTAGTLLVAGTMTYDATASQTMPSGWVQVASITAGGAVGKASLWYYPNNPGGITGVTVANSAASYIEIIILEYSGVIATSPLDQVGTHTATATTSATVSTAGATTAATELAVAYLRTSASQSSMTPGGSFVSAQSDLSFGVNSISETTGAAGVITATETYASSADYAMLIATFKAAGGASSTRRAQVFGE